MNPFAQNLEFQRNNPYHCLGDDYSWTENLFVFKHSLMTKFLKIKLFIQTLYFFYFLNSVFFHVHFYCSVSLWLLYCTSSFILFNSNIFIYVATLMTLFHYLRNLVNLFSFIQFQMAGTKLSFVCVQSAQQKNNKQIIIIHLW